MALDLIGRKVMGSGGKLLRNPTRYIYKYCEARNDQQQLLQFIEPLIEANQQGGELTIRSGEKAMDNPDEIGAASVDYLMYGGYLIFTQGGSARGQSKNSTENCLRPKKPGGIFTLTPNF